MQSTVYFFIDLFKYGLLKVMSIECRMEGWLMNDELESMWKVKVLACFKILSRHSLRGAVENHEKYLLEYSYRVSNRAPPV
jgi:hypothetical protein